MRRDVQEIYRNTPHSKQVMMFSATLSKDVRPVCKKFMQDVCFLKILSKTPIFCQLDMHNIVELLQENLSTDFVLEFKKKFVHKKNYVQLCCVYEQS